MVRQCSTKVCMSIKNVCPFSLAEGKSFSTSSVQRCLDLVQLSISSHAQNGGAYFLAVYGSNLVPISATEGHGHRVCYRLLGFFSRAHFFCFPEVCCGQSWLLYRHWGFCTDIVQISAQKNACWKLCSQVFLIFPTCAFPKSEAATWIALIMATKNVSAREKTKQPIADSVPMSFCSTNRI